MAELVTDTMLDILEAIVRAGSGLPTLSRNETLDQGLEAIGEHRSGWLNMVDGDVNVDNELLGGGGSYDLVQEARFELLVRARSESDGRSALAGLISAIADQIDYANDDGNEDGLAVQGCVADITRLQRDNLASDGIPFVKGAILTVRLQMTSDRPF
ncbi:hypothetical protein [uncultured Cohaesibacter sp.]|uniref:hypothetical protein n=1 Tax=uncultured Cohaesibacter sp. TaxID=1002546 RepID=UPI0029C7FCEE|nr:hypothetical protein [uncultured Cohaesibacter sp.]